MCFLLHKSCVAHVNVYECLFSVCSVCVCARALVKGGHQNAGCMYPFEECSCGPLNQKASCPSSISVVLLRRGPVVERTEGGWICVFVMGKFHGGCMSGTQVYSSAGA